MKWYDKVSNAAVNVLKEKTELSNLPPVIANLHYSLFGDVSHLPKITPALQALQLSANVLTGIPPAADWKHPLGRPQKTWLQQTEDTGMTVGASQLTSLDCCS